MNDRMALCGRCGHEHAVGILRYDQQGTPLYGARLCIVGESAMGMTNGESENLRLSGFRRSRPEQKGRSRTTRRPDHAEAGTAGTME